MPTYDYACTDCGGFEAFRSLAQRNDPAVCPDCSAESPRVFVSAMRRLGMSRGHRKTREVTGG